nr:MAG TPA: hypothetical protein [Caudoviricetes sp.]
MAWNSCIPEVLKRFVSSGISFLLYSAWRGLYLQYKGGTEINQRNKEVK